MFGWLYSALAQWRARRRLAKRALFRYFDGRRDRWGDPAAIWRALCNHPQMDFPADVEAADAGQEPEATKVRGVLCEIFAVQAWDERSGQGLTDWELVGLVRQFEEYVTRLKKTTNPGRMPLQLWGLDASTSPADLDAVTSVSSDCGSTPSESPTAEDSPCSEPSKAP